MAGPAYNPNAYFPVRFFSLAWEGIRTTPSRQHEANPVEKIGNGILYLPENLPRYIKKVCTNPQAVTIAIFATAHLANSYLFYPSRTWETLKFAASFLPEVTLDMARFAAWFTGSTLITGVCARAGGRLTEEYINSLSRLAGQ